MPSWLRELIEVNSLQPVAPDVVEALLEDTEVATLRFQRTLLRMTSRGLLRRGTLHAVLDELARRRPRNGGRLPG